MSEEAKSDNGMEDLQDIASPADSMESPSVELAVSNDSVHRNIIT